MNIFYVSQDPKECAECLDDKRIKKMFSETIQMLSIAVHTLHPTPSIFSYGPVPCDLTSPRAYFNHPSSIWVRESWAHAEWCNSLNIQFMRLIGEHAQVQKAKNLLKAIPVCIFPNRVWVRKPPFIAEEGYDGLRQGKCTEKLYRDYLNWKWDKTKNVSWTIGIKPSWRR